MAVSASAVGSGCPSSLASIFPNVTTDQFHLNGHLAQTVGIPHQSVYYGLEEKGRVKANVHVTGHTNNTTN